MTKDLAAENEHLRAIVRALNDLLFSDTGKTVDEIVHLVSENERLRAAFKQAIAKLEAGQPISSAFCSYCAERWPKLDGETVEVAREHARRHALVCESHPFRERDRAVERLLFLMHIYPGYQLNNRGVIGCISDAVEALAPEVYAAVGELGWDEAYTQYFDAETQHPKRRIA